MTEGNEEHRLVTVNIAELIAYLEATRERISEADLMERFVGESHSGDENMNLFFRHFELYHTLYSLESDLGRRGLALDIGLAYVQVHDIPSDHECHYFDEGYCRRPAGPGKRCRVHKDLDMQRHGSVGRVSMRGYYLDRRNAFVMDEQRLTGMINGVYEYASNQQQIEAAYELLGVSRRCSPERLRTRFRYLSKRYHPDAGGDADYFTRLQDAYERLLRLHSLQSP